MWAEVHGMEWGNEKDGEGARNVNGEARAESRPEVSYQMASWGRTYSGVIWPAWVTQAYCCRCLRHRIGKDIRVGAALTSPTAASLFKFALNKGADAHVRSEHDDF